MLLKFKDPEYSLHKISEFAPMWGGGGGGWNDSLEVTFGKFGIECEDWEENLSIKISCTISGKTMKLFKKNLPLKQNMTGFCTTLKVKIFNNGTIFS